MSNTLKISALLFTLWVHVEALYAQKGLRIEGRISNAKPAKLVLVQHFGGELMPIDTAVLGADGLIVWEEKEPLPAGVCRILGIGRGLDIIINETQRFSFEADMRDVIATIRFANSPENTLFFQYQREVRKRYQAALAYREQMAIKDDNDPRWKNRFQTLNESVKRYVDSLYQKKPQSLTVRYLKSHQEPVLPVLPLKQLSLKDSLYLRSYAIEHFFDHSFLSDERMIYTPTVAARFARFLKLLPHLPKETLFNTVDNLIRQTNGTRELRKFVVGKFAQEMELTPFVVFDELYKHIVEKYVESDPELWEAGTLQKLKEIKEIKEKLAIGTDFPTLLLTDPSGKVQSSASIQREYTVVFFYDPGCSHCREATPQLTSLARKYADKMQVYAVSLDAEEKPWKEFMEEFKTEAFINVRDASRKIEFYKLGVLNYPTVYLLDRDKKIAARWLNVQQLASYLLNR